MAVGSQSGRDRAHQECLVLGVAMATLITLAVGTHAATHGAPPPKRVRSRRSGIGGHRLFRWGREACWQRLGRNERTLICWDLVGLDRVPWSAEARARHAPAGTRIR